MRRETLCTFGNCANRLTERRDRVTMTVTNNHSGGKTRAGFCSLQHAAAWAARYSETVREPKLDDRGIPIPV